MTKVKKSQRDSGPYQKKANLAKNESTHPPVSAYINNRDKELLKESEERYHLLFETSLDGAFITSPEGKILDINKAGINLFGYSTKEEMLKLDLATDVYVDPGDRKQILSKIHEQGSHKYEVKVKKKDGTVILTQCLNTAVRNDAGEILCYQGVIRDITGIRQTEEELQISMHTTLIMSQIADIFLLVTDEEMYSRVLDIILVATSSKFGLFGYVAENGDLVVPSLTEEIWHECRVEGKSIIFPPETWGKSIWGKSINEKRAFYSDGPFHIPKGHIPVKHFLIVPIIFGNETIGIFSVARDNKSYTEDDKILLGKIAIYISPILKARLERDIQEKKREQAIKALRKSEHSLAEAQRIVHLGTWELDAKTNSVQWSDEVYKILGMDPDETAASYETFLGTVHPDDRNLVNTTYMNSFQKNETYNITHRIIRKSDGKIRYVHEIFENIRDSSGQVIGSRGTIQDITELKQAEVKIESQIQRLSALRAIDTAISSSFDLPLILKIFLEQVTMHLHVDAAIVFLYNQSLNELEFTAQHGLFIRNQSNLSFKLGESYTGKAALERRIISIANLPGDLRPATKVELACNEAFATIFVVPLITKGQVKGVLEVFHRKPFNPDPEWFDFLEMLSKQSAIAIDNTTLFQNLERSNAELAIAYDATIEGWSGALDLRDKETKGHSLRVTEMTLTLARSIGINDRELVNIRYGALLHDIGIMGIPDNILHKSGPLTEEEWTIMKKHPIYAFELLSPISYLNNALDIPYCHHEKWDGTGYPRGLKGEQIPLAARIFAVVDVWDALISGRPYRPAWPKENALEYIQTSAGTHFDPNIQRRFIETKIYEMFY